MSGAAPTRAPGEWRRVLLVSAAIALAVVASLASHRPPERLAVQVKSVPLNPEDPQQRVVGPLRFRGGLWLRSVDPRFGGLSDLRVSGDGSRLLAVSDCGHGFVARLDYDAGGHLAGLRDAELVELLGPEGRPLTYREIDAEGLALDDGGLMVSFEGDPPRLWRYHLTPPFAGRPEPRPAPPFEESCRGNRGPELLASLDDGGILVACEGDPVGLSSTTFWVGRQGRWTAHSYPLVREGWGGTFRPTAATRHPGGGVLVLERRYPPLGIRVMHLAHDPFRGQATLEPREVARLEAPLAVDNFEGLDARRDEGGAILLYLLSDDNGCAKRPGIVTPRVQRTLLLLFELQRC